MCKCVEGGVMEEQKDGEGEEAGRWWSGLDGQRGVEMENERM